MTERLNYRTANPEAIGAMRALEDVVRQGSLEGSLLELVRMRVSQINSCAHCIDMHSKDARRRRNRTTSLRALGVARGAVFL